MSKTDPIHACTALSLGLRKILAKAQIDTFGALSKHTRLSLRALMPKLKVRHLANLEHELGKRNKSFASDNSIRLDHFINQRKLFNLWEKGIETYKELDALPYEEFVEAVGGPQSRFFRNKSARKLWLENHDLTLKKRIGLTHLPDQTADLLYKAGLTSLREVAQKTDYQLARLLQPSFGKNKDSVGSRALSFRLDFGTAKRTGLEPLTRVRLIEIRYALYKEGIDRPCKPL